MHADTVAQRRIGRYVLLDLLGRGAMGVVHRAQDPLINRTVAVKLLHILQALSPDQTAVVHERFMREAQTAGNLDHPNIVKIYDVGHDDETGEFYIVMEYLAGSSLERRLEGARFGTRETLELVRGLASALDAAHARGIVHRDIKPANILFTDDGLAKITDFGIARITTSHLTQDVRDLGTPVFMSPEQVSGRALDGRADLFSLGIVTYQMLAGTPPFDGKNMVSLAYQIVHSTPPLLRESVPGLPAGVDEVMAKILAKDPIQRYATGKAFVEALEEALGGTRVSHHDAAPIRTSPQAPAPSVPMRAPRALIGAGAIVLAVGGILVARSLVGGREAPKSEPPAATRADVPPPPAPAPVATPTKPSRSPVPAQKTQKDRAPATQPKAAAPLHVPPPALHPEPVEVAVVSPPSEPAHEPVHAAPVPAEPAHVSIALGHWISRGTLTVYADGAPILVHDFSKKKIVPFQTSSWEAVDVPAGARELSAKVVTPKGETFSASGYAIELGAGKTATVRLGLRNENLSFKKPGSEKDDPESGAAAESPGR